MKSTSADFDAFLEQVGSYSRVAPETVEERIATLRERQIVLSNELEKVNRELNAMGANDG